jgi:hypothetical protein
MKGLTQRFTKFTLEVNTLNSVVASVDDIPHISVKDINAIRAC